LHMCMVLINYKWPNGKPHGAWQDPCVFYPWIWMTSARDDDFISILCEFLWWLLHFSHITSRCCSWVLREKYRQFLLL
jgi:hypothetical protein